MFILSSEQIRRLDQYTIDKQVISSWDLMERASNAFVDCLFQVQDPEPGSLFTILCGTGNNGGDGMAIARLLSEREMHCEVYILPVAKTESEDFRKNKYLAGEHNISIHEVSAVTDIPEVSEDSIIIDAVLGSGLNRPLDSDWRAVLEEFSYKGKLRIAVDIPSGLFADKPTEFPGFKADLTYTFHCPKLAFFFPENQDEVGDFFILDIELETPSLPEFRSHDNLFTTQHARGVLRERKRFDHKGTFGHALMVAGSYGKVGAAVLTAKAALRAGAGLVSIHAPKSAYQILQISFPEAMVEVDSHEYIWTETSEVNKYAAIGVGPGIGKNELTVKALSELLRKASQPLVLDADALNILAEYPDLWDCLPEDSVLTPHPKEAERLFGKFSDSFERIDNLKSIALAKKIYIILKGGNTVTFCPDGTVWFNNNGNPGMATGGSGDALTGIITGLIAQGYTAKEASLLGVYLHGSAGDFAFLNLEMEALLASDIIDHLGMAFRHLRGLL